MLTANSNLPSRHRSRKSSRVHRRYARVSHYCVRQTCPIAKPSGRRRCRPCRKTFSAGSKPWPTRRSPRLLSTHSRGSARRLFEAGRPFHNFRALRNQLALRHHPFVKSAAHRFGPAPPEADRALPHSAPPHCARRFVRKKRHQAADVTRRGNFACNCLQRRNMRADGRNKSGWPGVVPVVVRPAAFYSPCAKISRPRPPYPNSDWRQSK
jgi:hypothetical protein